MIKLCQYGPLHCCFLLLWVASTAGGTSTSTPPIGDAIQTKFLGRILNKIRCGSMASAEAAIEQDNPTSSSSIIRVAYQGEPGAYSEKATRELLGPNVFAVGRPSFEAAFRAVASMEVDYACLPIENSLGGSIHENYDLMLRYQL